MKRLALMTVLLVPALAAAAQQLNPMQVAPPPINQNVPSPTTDHEPLGFDEPEVAVISESTVLPRYRPVTTSPGGWFGDLGFYVLRPQWSGGNPAFATAATTTLVTPGIPSIENQILTFEQTDFDHDPSFAPLVSLGYAGRNGLGVRARWWTLTATDSVAGNGASGVLFESLQESSAASFIVPSLLGTTSELGTLSNHIANKGGLLEITGSFRNRLDMDVIDAEGIWDTNVGRSSLLISAGVRYAHLGQSDDGQLALVAETDNATASLRSLQSFSGAGPTVALQAYRVIGQTNLSIYGLGRGSLLYGESRQRAMTFIAGNFDVDTDPVDRTITSSVALDANSLRPVLELEVGGNWTRSLQAFDWFVETGFVGMVWFNAGNAAHTEALVGSEMRAVGSDSAQANLGLVGLRFATGVRF